MAWYKIYAGLSGGFGGSKYQGTYEFDNEGQAYEAAHQLAVEEFQSYEGLHGLLDYDDCRQEVIDNLITDQGDSPYQEDIDALADEYYKEEIESSIDYYIELATGPEGINNE